MSIKAIFESMALLVQQHKELNTISAQKTELIKQNQTKELSALLKEESKHIRRMEQTEKKRQEATASYLHDKEETQSDGTVSVLLKHIPEDYHDPLLKLQDALFQEMTSLRKKEALNRTLVEDSLQFVQMTLDMIQPDPEAIHYTHPEADGTEKREGYSTFDSKA
ncbi:flagellar protein FlgN [Salibacterium salarium]|uniref:Flagellar protein FlgN n=1 Tax=Salibacterium salarium TaxID=284579 RepID=A0A428N9R5_9BACI|nr:flagellar protein FlgN [Salibacterium salarium]RSL35127.1 flagellar protein FlgN [Salibacterium salarium]